MSKENRDTAERRKMYFTYLSWKLESNELRGSASYELNRMGAEVKSLKVLTHGCFTIQLKSEQECVHSTTLICRQNLTTSTICIAQKERRCVYLA